MTKQPLPLPARQAALCKALDTVVLLGFPEWSIWDIPLVGHEIGLAYANDQNNRGLIEIVQGFTSNGSSGRPEKHTRPAQESVHELLADAFGAYTLGLAYACAALLLRLNPVYGEQPDYGRPRDIDRAQVIMTTLMVEAQKASMGGGTFTDAVELLRETWQAAVRAHAGPALEEKPVEEGWIQDLSQQAVDHFDSMFTIRPYDWPLRASSHSPEALHRSLPREPDIPALDAARMSSVIRPEPDASVADLVSRAAAAANAGEDVTAEGLLREVRR